MKATKLLITVLLSCVTLQAQGQQQSKPTDSWSALRDSAKIAPLQPADPAAPPSKNELRARSTTAASEASNALTALRECNSTNLCPPEEMEQRLKTADVAVRNAIEANIEALIADEDELRVQHTQISGGIKTFTENQGQAAAHLSKLQEEINQASNEVAQLNLRAVAILRSNLAPVEKATQIDVLGGEIRLRQSLLDSQRALAQSVKRGLDMAEPQRATLENYLRDLQGQITVTQQARRNLEAVSTLYQMFFAGKHLELVLLRQTEARKGGQPNSVGTLLDMFAPSNQAADEQANAAARSKMEQLEAERMKKITACIEKGGSFAACHAQFPAGGT